MHQFQCDTERYIYLCERMHYAICYVCMTHSAAPFPVYVYIYLVGYFFLRIASHFSTHTLLWYAPRHNINFVSFHIEEWQKEIITNVIRKTRTFVDLHWWNCSLSNSSNMTCCIGKSVHIVFFSRSVALKMCPHQQRKHGLPSFHNPICDILVFVNCQHPISFYL